MFACVVLLLCDICCMKSIGVHADNWRSEFDNGHFYLSCFILQQKICLYEAFWCGQPGKILMFRDLPAYLVSSRAWFLDKHQNVLIFMQILRICTHILMLAQKKLSDQAMSLATPWYTYSWIIFSPYLWSHIQ